MPDIQEGYLLIADISGYTIYLTQSELDHAQQVLEALLQLLINETRPPLRISRLEGDAVISYTRAGFDLQGQTFIEIIESTYVAFRRTIELLIMNNTCKCNACANISSLDLKFIVHYGTFGIQHLGGQEELVGSDVNLIHRLLKNRITNETEIRAYAAYTGPAVENLGLDDFREKLVFHQEQYEHLGSVEVWIQDLHPVWQERRSTLRVTIPPEMTLLQIETEIAMPPEIVWNYLIQAEYRKTLFGADQLRVAKHKNGRITVGSVYQCYHGDKYVPETIIQWLPFEEIITEDLIPIPFKNTSMFVDLQLYPTPAGTRFVQVCSKARGHKLGAIIANAIMRLQSKQAKRDLDAFAAVIEEDYARAAGKT